MDPLCSQCENPGQGECIADGGSRGDVLATPFSLQDWIHLLAFGEPPPNPAAEPKVRPGILIYDTGPLFVFPIATFEDSAPRREDVPRVFRDVAVPIAPHAAVDRHDPGDHIHTFPTWSLSRHSPTNSWAILIAVPIREEVPVKVWRNVYGTQPSSTFMVVNMDRVICRWRAKREAFNRESRELAQESIHEHHARKMEAKARRETRKEARKAAAKKAKKEAKKAKQAAKKRNRDTIDVDGTATTLSA